jgi:paraquat-inducible protein B
MSDGQGHDRPQRTQALTKKSRWPGWIWAVPIAAAAVTGWLLLREFVNGGIDVTVSFDNAAGMKAKDTKLQYRGIEIGSVSSIALSEDRKHVVAHLDVDADQKGALNAGTRFYLEGEPSLAKLSSLKSILSGPTIEMVPGEGAAQRQFTGFIGDPPPHLTAAVPYLAKFEDAVGGLKPGASVMMRGFVIGEVDNVQLGTDPHSGTISATVILLLDPTRFNLPGAPAPADGNWAPVMNAALSELVAHGLRARLDQKPPVIGEPRVVLDMTPDTGGALGSGGRYPEIPAASGGGVENLVSQAGKLPLGKIGDEVEAITDHLKTLVSSPQLGDAIDHLDKTLGELDQTVKDAGPKIAPTIQSARQTIDGLRKTASEIDATAEAVKEMTGASRTAPNGNLQQALAELTQTGRAVRSLADYLDQHPEALIKGR